MRNHPLQNQLQKALEPKHPPQQTIAIDVDNTLFVGGVLDEKVVNFAKAKHVEGFELIIWSSRGSEYAKGAMVEAGLSEIARAISKPGYVLDDDGWEWTRYTRVIPLDEI